MDLPDVMDAIQVHAAAAAAAVDASFRDVAVGHPTPRGRCVRIFYGGEREPTKMPFRRSLDSRLVAESVMVRAFWPVSDYSAKQGKALMAEMWGFKDELRTRVLGDSQLGGESIDLEMQMAEADDVLIAGDKYAIEDIEFVIDAGEYTRST